MSWANQLVLLKGNFEQLGSVIGGVLINAFKPFVKALNSVMSAVISFAETVSNALGAIFGWKYESSGGVADDMTTAADAADDLADSTGTAADNAKKIKSYTLGIDELNILEPDDDSSSGSSGSSSSGTGSSSSSASSGEWVRTESIFESYTSSIDSLYELGSYISDVLTDAMNSINWDDIYATAENWGSGLADFLNGLITPELFGALGDTIAGALNTALHFLDSFGQTFDFENFGHSLATGVNHFFDTFEFSTLASAINRWANGILDAIIAFLTEVEWLKIGQKIGEFLEEVQWLEFLQKAAIVIGEALLAMLDVAIGMFSVAPLETAIVAAIVAIVEGPKILAALESLKNLGTTIATNINTAFTTLSTAFGNISPYLPTIGAIAVAVLGLEVAFRTLESSYQAEVAADIEQWLTDLGVSDVVNNLNSTAENLQDIADSMEEVQKQLNADNSNLDWLIDEYFRLEEQTDLTAAQQLLLKDYAGQLVAIVPELSGLINTQTGEFTGNKDELYKLVEAHKQYAAAMAYQDLISQYNKALAEAEIELEANAQKYQECSERLDTLNYIMSTTERGSREQIDALQILSDTWGIQLDTWEDATEYALAMEEGMNRCTEAEKDLAEGAEAAQSKLEIANQKYQEVADGLNDVEEAATNAGDSIEDMSEKANESIEGNPIDTTSMTDALNDVEEAATNAGDSGKEIPEKINEGIASTPIDLTPIQTAISNAGDSMNNSGQELWNELSSGYNRAIEEDGEDTKGETKSWAAKVLDWLKEAFVIHSPSVKFKEIAQYCVTGYNNGITENASSSQSPISTWASNILNWFGGEGDDKVNTSSFESFANKVITGFNNWTQSHFNSSSTPIGKWASGILTWFGGSGNDRVNSTVFGGFANNVITGFNSWVEGNFGSTETPISSWVSGIMDWFSGDNESGKVNTTTFGEFASNIISGFANIMGIEYTNSQGEMETWASSILEWFWGDSEQSKESGLASKFKDFGSWIMEGLESGLRSMWDTVKGLISDIADSINDLMEAEEEIGSPSKRFYRYGKWMMEGLANGLVYGSDEALEATSFAANQLAMDFSPENLSIPSLRVPEVTTPQLGYAYAVSYSSQLASEVTMGDTLGNIIETIIESKLVPLIQSSTSSRDELLEEIANKDTSIYMDSRRVNQMLDRQRSRSGHTLRKQY